MTPKQEERIVRALSWICSAIILGATFYIITKL
jgi:hypothetical protein